MKLRTILGAFGAAVALVAAAVTPAVGTGTGLPEGFVEIDGGGYAIELKAPSPDWYTAELHERVVAAARDGEAVPIPPTARSDVDVALLFAGIRPGSWMISPAWCTMNFVFGGAGPSLGGNGNGNGGGNGGGKDKGDDHPGNNGNGKGNNKDDGERSAGTSKLAASTGSGVYIGTAGHCSEAGEEVTIIAAPGVLMNIGRTVISIDNGVGDDFALVEIHPEMTEWVNPSMAVIAGPTGTSAPAFADPVLHVGHGVAIGTGGTPRAGLTSWIGEGSESGGYGWTGAANLGDSGSGVRSASGEAVGNLTHLIVGVPYAPANVAGTSIDRILQIAGASLSTASLVPDPLP